MLFSLGRMEDLEDYIHKSSDGDLLKWWAAYLESEGRLDKAKKYYKKGGDFRSLVRLSCFEGTDSIHITSKYSCNPLGATPYILLLTQHDNYFIFHFYFVFQPAILVPLIYP